MSRIDHIGYIARLSAGGWTAFASVAAALSARGLPLPDEGFLRDALAPSVWEEVDDACDLLERRFADSVEWGPLLVPSPRLLDVRQELGKDVRDSQQEITRPDFVDTSLPAGVDLCDPAAPWTLFVTVVSDSGLAMGSYDDVRGRDDDLFTVAGTDTRTLMTRQLWSSLVLQNLRAPDSERRERWTFTVLAGEEPVGGRVVSGTVLHGQVRQRLGKAGRGSAPARVRPALRVAAAAPLRGDKALPEGGVRSA